MVPLQFFNDLVSGGLFKSIKTEFQSENYDPVKDARVEDASGYSEILEEFIHDEYVITYKEYFERMVRNEIRQTLNIIDEESSKAVSREHLQVFFKQISIKLDDLITKESSKAIPEHYVLDALKKVKQSFIHRFISLKDIYTKELEVTERMKFSVNQYELISLFLILKHSGIIDSNISEPELVRFIEFCCMYKKDQGEEYIAPSTIRKQIEKFRKNRINTTTPINFILDKIKTFNEESIFLNA